MGTAQVLTAATTEDVTSVLGIFEIIAKKMFALVGDVVEIVMANPLLLIPIGIVFTYAIIKVFKMIF